jgi:hypothetical protein
MARQKRCAKTNNNGAGCVMNDWHLTGHVFEALCRGCGDTATAAKLDELTKDAATGQMWGRCQKAGCR